MKHQQDLAGSPMSSDNVAGKGVDQVPSMMVDDPDLLLLGTYSKAGFDLVITGADGRQLVVADYFSFVPPPNLMLPSGAGLSPEMVRSLLHLPTMDMMVAGPAPTDAAVAIVIGEVKFALGRVFRIDKDGVRHELHKGDKVYLGDELIVDGKGYIRVEMLDHTKFNLGTDGRAILEDYSFDEADKSGNFQVLVTNGGFNYASGDIGIAAGLSRDHAKIRTPNAIIGIRGSELDGTVTAGQTIIVHKSGLLTVTDINGLNPVTLDIPGNTAVIALNASPVFTSEASPEQVQLLQATLPPPASSDSTTGQDTTDTGTGTRTGTTGTGTGTGTTGTGNTGTGTTGTGGTTGTDSGTTHTRTDFKPVTRPPATTEDTTLPPDNPPKAVNDSVTVAEKGSIALGTLLLANDRDPDAGQTPRLTDLNTLNTIGTLSFNSTRSLSDFGHDF
jgi:hypothetical protein